MCFKNSRLSVATFTFVRAGDTRISLGACRQKIKRTFCSYGCLQDAYSMLCRQQNSTPCVLLFKTVSWTVSRLLVSTLQTKSSLTTVVPFHTSFSSVLQN